MGSEKMAKMFDTLIRYFTSVFTKENFESLPFVEIEMNKTVSILNVDVNESFYIIGKGEGLPSPINEGWLPVAYFRSTS